MYTTKLLIALPPWPIRNILHLFLYLAIWSLELQKNIVVLCFFKTYFTKFIALRKNMHNIEFFLIQII